MVHPEGLSNLRNRVGVCLEGSNQAVGISWDRNILVANANLSSCENECNILPAVCMCFLESTQKTELVLYGRRAGYFPKQQTDALSCQRDSTGEMEQQTFFFSKLSSLYSLQPTTQYFRLPLQGKKIDKQ